jgi:predicted nucleotide-binding protein (sugar kinase/HSP70/actin superfamily)
MGSVALGASALCRGLGIDYVAPRPNCKLTLRTGAYYAPEEICLPFKLMLGNFIECIERGADTILLTGSCGPCRFGEYCELSMKILRNIGYRDLKFIVLDASPEIGLAEFLRRLDALMEQSPAGRFGRLRAWKTAYDVAAAYDGLEAEAHWRAGFEQSRGECRRILNDGRAKAPLCGDPKETLRLLREAGQRLRAVPGDPAKNPLKVAVVGEIFTIIDPFSNLGAEDKLMEYGVSSRRMLTPSWWVRDLMLKPVKLNCRRVYAAAQPYLPHPVGGHGRECVGETVLASEEGMDGAIQIFPLGCMPEIAAKAVLPAVQRDRDFPVLSLVVDEVAGEAGYLTRLEAFLDMLESRRKMQGRDIV